MTMRPYFQVKEPGYCPTWYRSMSNANFIPRFSRLCIWSLTCSARHNQKWLSHFQCNGMAKKMCCRHATGILWLLNLPLKTYPVNLLLKTYPPMKISWMVLMLTGAEEGGIGVLLHERNRYSLHSLVCPNNQKLRAIPCFTWGKEWCAWNWLLCMELTVTCVHVYSVYWTQIPCMTIPYRLLEGLYPRLIYAPGVGVSTNYTDLSRKFFYSLNLYYNS